MGTLEALKFMIFHATRVRNMEDIGEKLAQGFQFKYQADHRERIRNTFICLRRLLEHGTVSSRTLFFIWGGKKTKTKLNTGRNWVVRRTQEIK